MRRRGNSASIPPNRLNPQILLSYLRCQRALKISFAILLIVFAGIASADDKTACLLKHYDEYSNNRVTLFEKVQVVYEQKHPKVYEIYGPVLRGHALFAKIDQYVFHYFAEKDISRLKLRHGITNAVPNWIKDACNGRDCVNALHMKLIEFPEFDALYTQWNKLRKQTNSSYKQKEIAQAGKMYFELLGEKSILPHALKDMRYYGLKVNKLICGDAVASLKKTH